MSWIHHQVIHLRHTDAAGLLYAPRLLEMAQDALEALQSAAGVSLRERLEGPGPILPTVHCEADFLRPIRLGDKIAVEVRLQKQGRRSFTLAYVFRSPSGEELARGTTVHVAMDRATGTSAELTEGMTRILGFLKGTST